MKKLILIITILFTNINLNSQITKGYWMYGGSGTYTHYTHKFSTQTVKYSTIKINPNVGYFIWDNLAIGGIIRYMNRREGNNRYNQYGLGILTRYYFLNSNRITNIYIQANYTYGIHFSHSYETDENGYLHFYGSKIGYVIFLTNSVGLEAFLDYEISSFNQFTHTTYSTNSTTIKVGIGFHIHLTK